MSDRIRKRSKLFYFCYDADANTLAYSHVAINLATVHTGRLACVEMTRRGTTGSKKG